MTDDLLIKPQNNVGVIIQARMTSKRFPGKSMADLMGKPVVEHVIRNCMLIKPLNKLIIAVPDTDDSEPIIQLAYNIGIDNFCGSEDDVLGRYYFAAKYFKLTHIVRITGDCPYINPKVCSEVLQLLLFRKLDYCANCYPVRTYPKGLDCEAFTWDALEAAHLATDGDGALPGDREHVTPWLQRTPGLRRACVQQHIDASHIDLCIDVPEDIERTQKWKLEVSKR